ncbi:MAG: ABC transporter permease, partial [Planctomycetes bacterium]|nr:ABC transporter permease [Planctomycetota bacterium]
PPPAPAAGAAPQPADAGLRMAELTIASEVLPQVATNLWAVIPGQKDKVFSLEAEEAIVLAADFATSGVVPDACPDSRLAANAALLAQVAADLASAHPARTIYVVFFGGHWNAEEGARNFYYALRKAVPTADDKDPLPDRRQACEDEIKRLEQYRAVLQAPAKMLPPNPGEWWTGPQPAPDAQANLDKAIFKLLESKLLGITNNYNFELQQMSVKKIAGDGTPEMEALEKALRAEKRQWNNVRRLVGDIRRGVPHVCAKDVDPREVYKYFNVLLTKLVGDVDGSLAIMRQELAENLDAQKLAGAAVYYLPFTGADPAQETPKQKLKRLRGREIVGHYTFDFAAADRPWMFAMNGDQRLLNSLGADAIGSFGRHLAALGAVFEKNREAGWSAPLLMSSLNCPVPTTHLCYPGERVISACAAHAVKVYGYNLVTAGDRLDGDDMPTAGKFDLRPLRTGLAAYCAALASDPSLSIGSQLKKTTFDRDANYYVANGSVHGKKANLIGKGSTDIEGVAVGAMYAYFSNAGIKAPPVAGRNRIAVGLVNSLGGMTMPNVAQVDDRKFMGLMFDANGSLTHISNYNDWAKDGRLFFAYGGGLNRAFNPASYIFFSEPKVLNAANDSEFKQSVFMSSPTVSVLYLDRPDRCKYIGNGLVLLGATKNKFNGFGISPTAKALASLDATFQGASDYNTLNLDSRLTDLQKRNIVNNSLWELQTDAKDHIDSAAEARKAGDQAKASAHDIFALVLGYRTYQPLKDMSNDIVSAVVVLMLLSIPFAFVLERLICGFPVIYKQIGGFIFFFLLTLLLLRLCHPAFQIASSPEVIFLAFVIILMSALVIFIVMGKFRHEIKAMQGLASKAHSAGAESSTALASVLIGISGMRNRPLKTALTAVTIILLTFTILVFSSFSSRMGVVTTYLGAGMGEARVELHQPSFLQLPEVLIESMEKMVGNRYVFCRRAARFVDPMDSRVFRSLDKESVVYNPANGQWVALECVMGLEKAELANNQELRDKVIPGFVAAADAKEKLPPLFLSATVADKLLVKPGDELRICGASFRYAGGFEPSAMQNFANIDGTRVMAPNFKATMQENKVEGNNEQIEAAFSTIDVSSFTWTQPGLCAVTTYAAMRDIGGVTNFVTLYPREGADVNISATASELARVFNAPVFLRDREGAKQFFFTRSFSGAGFGDIVVPLILGGLIIFSSLLGSIVDREKEIFTYSALGLAPKDVAALFFAESSVYAIVGGVGGYLFSQLVAKILSFLASLNVFSPPEMNFSSLSSMYTILLVMAVVILSTIYPAIKAGRSANSGVNRKWRMPEPHGDDINFVFPFTVSSADMTGILSYIKEFFDSHASASLGNFAARDVKISGTPGNCDDLAIGANLSLAPFDLGIFQEFRMKSQPSDIEGIQEVVIDIHRQSGSPSSWLRSNRNFVSDLRNQFLIWRSLPLETMVHYRQMTEETLRKQR